MVYSSEFSRPSECYIGTSRNRSSSLSRYSSPVRSCNVSSSRASTPLASYRIPAFRSTLQESADSPNSSYRSRSSSRKSSCSRESSVPTPRTLLPETGYSPYSCRRDSITSNSTHGSSRRSSFSKKSPTSTKKHVHFKEEEKETNSIASRMSNKGSFNLESMHGINRKGYLNSPIYTYDDNSDGMRKLSVRERYPDVSSDACRKRQARAAYMSALEDTGINIKCRARL